MTVQPIPATPANQFTVASFNIERFYNTSSTDDLYYVPAGVNGFNGFNGNSSTPTVSTGSSYLPALLQSRWCRYQRGFTRRVVS